jgi:hypothetical protein
MDFESYGCFDVERTTAFSIMFINGTKKNIQEYNGPSGVNIGIGS